jgi:hypothetical protein
MKGDKSVKLTISELPSTVSMHAVELVRMTQLALKTCSSGALIAPALEQGSAGAYQRSAEEPFGFPCGIHLILPSSVVIVLVYPLSIPMHIAASLKCLCLN